MQQLEQQVISQSQEEHQLQLTPASDYSNVGDGDPSFVEKVTEGYPAVRYEPTPWPKRAITPDPYQHLAHTQGGGTNAHNNIVGALGVQSAAIPWDYRHYSGNLNTHRKMEPLIYTPLVIAKDHDGKSAVDLTSLINRKYQSQRMSDSPQYSNTLSALTDYKPIQLHPTDHWLPQIPIQAAPGVRNSNYWEHHFLDLYAPTPPPLRAPVAPKMKTPLKYAQSTKNWALLETEQHERAAMPDILKHGERVHPLVTSIVDAHTHQPIPFHDADSESAELRSSIDHEFNPSLPASSNLMLEEQEWQQPIMLEEDVTLEEHMEQME